jgi:hypothetical protein
LTKNKDGQYEEKKGLPASAGNKDAEGRARDIWQCHRYSALEAVEAYEYR